MCVFVRVRVHTHIYMNEHTIYVLHTLLQIPPKPQDRAHALMGYRRPSGGLMGNSARCMASHKNMICELTMNWLETGVYIPDLHPGYDLYAGGPQPSSGLVLTVGEVTRHENPLSPNTATVLPFQGWSAVISGMNMAEVIPG